MPAQMNTGNLNNVTNITSDECARFQWSSLEPVDQRYLSTLSLINATEKCLSYCSWSAIAEVKCSH